MKVFLNIWGCPVPGYGLMITTGVLLGNLFIFLSMRKRQDMTDFILLEAYALLGALVGSKLLYLITARNTVDWSRLSEADYFVYLMQNGFVFYGALIGGALSFYLAGKIHRISAMDYLRSHIAAVPFMHGVGRIGCFLAGCCYGIPWQGSFAVIFPEGSFAPPGIPLFPSQLVESFCLFLIAGVLLLMGRQNPKTDGFSWYLILYGTLRFVLEFFRGDALRGTLWGVSTSQWLSIPMLVLGCWMLRRKREKTAVSSAQGTSQ